jgi:hypothetical protein
MGDTQNIEVKAEITIRLMSNGAVGAKYSKAGLCILYGMLECARDVIQTGYNEQQVKVERSPIIIPPGPRIKPEDFGPMNGKS